MKVAKDRVVSIEPNRIIIDETVYEDFVGRFTERVRHLKYGDPNQPDTMVGPIINRAQMDHLRKHIDEARAAGIPQVLGGEPNGQVLPPHVFRDVDNEQPIARERGGRRWWQPRPGCCMRSSRPRRV